MEHRYQLLNNAHFFMLLTTGNKKPIALPICLLDEYSRKAAEILLDTTRDEQGRSNSKDAEFFIIDSEGTGIKVKISLAPLSMAYVSLKMLPKKHLLELKSQYCPFCNLPQNGETHAK